MQLLLILLLIKAKQMSRKDATYDATYEENNKASIIK